MEVDGKTALVTGSSRNIGRAVAETLAEFGADVGITARTDRDGCEESAATVEEHGREATVVLGDLADPEEVRRVVDTVRSDLGPIDVLVNNAAVRPEKPFLEMTVDDWGEVHDVNERAAYLTAQRALPDMIESGGGSVINLLGVGSITGTSPDKAHVSASKAGVIGLTRSLASSFGPDGVRINAVSPGPIDTERNLENYSGWEERNRKTIQATPLKRRGEPEEIADVCCFLASDRASYITGQVIHVNGGLYPLADIQAVE